jgi:DUF4097 and DUF4098 domain-containing protein YvlB
LRYRLHIGALAVLAIAVPFALAQENGNWSQNTSGTMPAARNIRIKLDMGSVVVQGGERQGIEYSIHADSDRGTRHQSGPMKISTSMKGDTAWIIGEWVGGEPQRYSGQLMVNIPRDAAWVKIETGGGAVEVRGIAGRVDVASGGGKVRADDIGGSMGVETCGDSIEIGSVAGDLKAETGGGNISVRSVKGTLHAETGGGNISIMSGDQSAVVEAGGGNVEIRHCAGHVKATTGGGSITLGDIGGPAEISTSGGSIRLASAKGRVSADTGAGSIELFGVPSAKVETAAGGITLKLVNTGGGEHNDSSVETSAGDITVYIAADVAISVRASVDMGSGHHIRSDFPDIHVSSEGDQWVKTLTAEGKLNGGGPVLKVRTTTGDICFRRGNQ